MSAPIPISIQKLFSKQLFLFAGTAKAAGSSFCSQIGYKNHAMTIGVIAGTAIRAPLKETVPDCTLLMIAWISPR